MVSDIYFPIPPSPYSFYPTSYPVENPPHRPRPQSMLANKPNKRNHKIYDTNKNQVPYYYSETLTPCMPNNAYGFTNVNQEIYRRKLSPKLQARINASPELSQFFTKSSYPQSFRPFSVLETTTKSPTPIIQRPLSVVPMTDQFRPASAYFPSKSELNEHYVFRSKAKPLPSVSKVEKPRQICRIPNCKCSIQPAVNPDRFKDMKTLPSVSERSFSKMKNLSLPSLKMDLEGSLKDLRIDTNKAERDTNTKPISEQHLGYV